MADICVYLTPGQQPAKTHPSDYQKPENPPHLPMYTRIWAYMCICIHKLYITHDVNAFI